MGKARPNKPAAGAEPSADSVDGEHTFTMKPGDALAGHEIERGIGAGAYGEVYVAWDPSGRRCALKRLVLLNKNDQKTKQRFLQEAAILQFVSHPNVVKCDAHGETNGVLWMRMELLEGANLRDYVHVKGGQLPLEQVLRLGRQACAGLSVLHSANVVHRDVKPENLFLLDGDILKVLDFGLAKLGSGSPALKTTGRVSLGTTLYMAPDYLERDGRGTVDPRWDVYGLGMTLYELLVGHPFVLVSGEVPSAAVAIKMHLDGNVLDLADLGVPTWAAAPLMRAVARQPADRFPSCIEFEKALAQAYSTCVAERVTGTIVPRTVSGRVQLSEATTEPDVVRHLTGVVSDLPTDPELSAPARALATHVHRSVREGLEGKPAPEPERPALVQARPLGPQGTTRMEPSPLGTREAADVLALVAFSPGPTPEQEAAREAFVRESGAAEERRQEEARKKAQELWATRPAAGRPALKVVPRADTAPLPPAPAVHDAAPPLAAPPPGHGAEGRGAVPEPHRAPKHDAANAEERRDGEGPPNAAPLPATAEARDAAEVALWLKQGYMPPEVAKKLGFRNVAAAAPESVKRAGPAERGARRPPSKALVVAARVGVGLVLVVVVVASLAYVWSRSAAPPPTPLPVPTTTVAMAPSPLGPADAPSASASVTASVTAGATGSATGSATAPSRDAVPKAATPGKPKTSGAQTGIGAKPDATPAAPAPSATATATKSNANTRIF